MRIKYKSLCMLIVILLIASLVFAPVTANAETGDTCSHSSLTHVPHVPSTCETEGIREHDICNDCGVKLMMGYVVSDNQIKAFKLYHNWIYSTKGNTITAACTRKAECGVKDVSISLFATNDYYTGNAYTGAYMDSEKWTSSGFFEPELYYYGRDNTDYRETTRAPKEIGKYTAKIFVGNNPSATVDFEIKEVPQGKYDGVETESGVVKNITSVSGVSNESNEFNAVLENESELETLVNVTPEEKTKGVNVWLEVLDGKDSIPWEDKEKIESVLGNDKLGLYLDISLLKRVGVSEANKVSSTNGRVKLSLTIPENLRENGRTYRIIRVHQGVATVLDGEYNTDTGVFTFETDQFSSYALTFSDGVNIPESGDQTNVIIPIAILIVALIIICGIIIYKRKVKN